MTVRRSQGKVGRNYIREIILAGGLSVALMTAISGAALGHAADGHPARIHNGTCEDLGPVAFRLNGVGASVDLDEAPLATPTAVNPDKAYQVMVTETTIDGTLDDLLASDHAVMVYDNDEDMQGIACGNVGGAMVGDALVTGLGEVGTPGHVGFAMFQPEGNQTLVTVIFGHAMAPVSAGGNALGDEHAEGDNTGRSHAEEDDDAAMATPGA
jgi:hypothetical protein